MLASQGGQPPRELPRGMREILSLNLPLVRKDGVDPPEGYVPKATREAAAAQRREAARKQQEKERREKESQDNTYRLAEAKLSALPEEQREELLSKARTALPAILRNSRLAVRTSAIKILIDSAMTQECVCWPAGYR